MNNNVLNFYRATTGEDITGHFYKVVALHHATDWSWERIKKEVPQLPRGWFELCRLPQNYRIEFTRDYWMGKLPYHQKLHDYLPQFFEGLEDVGVYLTQQSFGGPFEAHMVYSQQNDEGFYSGGIPLSEEGIERLAQSFHQFLLPSDYLAYLRVHDSFGKGADTGVMKANNLHKIYLDFQDFLSRQDPLLTQDGAVIDPRMLIPFYEAFGLHCYQCFFAGWHPQQEMGNIFYSGMEHTISDFRSQGSSGENLAFSTFFDWLLFYLKGLDEL